MSTSKVVKVEDVNRHGRGYTKYTPLYDRAKTNQTVSTDLLAYGTDSSVIPSRQDDDVALTEIDETEESKDKVYPLPENWPKIAQIFRRRSCELTASTAPCVNKAISHLELLQNTIDDWLKEREGEPTSRQDTAKKELRFIDTRESSSKRMRSATTQRSYSSHSSGQLSIHGFGFKEEEKAPVEAPDPYLGAEDAVDEVLTLMARLENDRQETEAALLLERERVIKLAQKIDHHCLRRMHELPAVVQKEHEECIVDLNELQWHVSYSSRNESRIKDRVEIAEVLNKRLKEDIQFVKKHIPLVEEKLELELEAMDKIKNAQTDTNQELDSTKNRQQKTEAKSNEASDKANKERDHIKRELDTVREALANINEELSEAKMTFNAYIHQINDIEQQLKDNEQELKVLEVKNENAKVAEEMQATKVQDITIRITEAEGEFERLERENSKLQAKLDEKRSEYTELISKLEDAVDVRDSRLRKVWLANQEVDMEVQDLQDKISECARQKVMDEKNVARIHKEMAKIQQQMSVTTEEFNRVATLNSSIRDQLARDQEKAFKMEENLKMTAETLKRQVKDEVHTKTVMASRIDTDTHDLQKSRVEIRERKNKYYDYYTDNDETDRNPENSDLAAKVADDVVTAVKNVKDKVEKLRSAKEDKKRKKLNLTSQQQETQKQKKESQLRFEERLEQIRPHHGHLKNDLLAVNKRLDYIEWKKDLMNNKMADMDKSQGMIDRMTAATSKALVTLGEDIEELDTQVTASQKIEDDLKFQYNELLDRVKKGQADHRKFMEERHKVHRQLDEEKIKSMELNKELASKYRSMQNNQIELKDKVMNNFEDRVKLENAIKDCRQLQSLQARMNGFMLEYYKYRGLFNQSELNRMEDQSVNNSHKVSQLQTSMDDALAHITDFIQTQMSGEATRKTAWAAVKKQEEKAARRAEKKGRAPVKTSSSVAVA